MKSTLLFLFALLQSLNTPAFAQSPETHDAPEEEISRNFLKQPHLVNPVPLFDFQSSLYEGVMARGEPYPKNLLKIESMEEYVKRAAIEATLREVDPIIEHRSFSRQQKAHPKNFFARGDTQAMLRFMAIQHAFRLATEAETREMTFSRRYISNYWEGLKGIRHMTWSDGDDLLKTNVVGHGLQGAVYFMIFWVNGQGRSVPVDAKSAQFWNQVFGASWKTALASLYFEFGPFLSETAIGGLGGKRHCMSVEEFKTRYPLQLADYRSGRISTRPRTSNCDHGYVDLVFTPAIGTGLAILEILKDKHVVQKLKASQSGFLRAIGIAIGYTNFATVTAQAMSFQHPTGSVRPLKSVPEGAPFPAPKSSTQFNPQISVNLPTETLGKGLKKIIKAHR